MALFIAVVVSDLKDIPFRSLTIALLLFLAFYSLSSISPRCGGAIVSSFSSVLFSLVSLFFFSFLAFFLAFLVVSDWSNIRALALA